MAYLDDLVAARDRYAAQLAAQTPPPDYSWNEYEEFLVAQLERLDKLIAAARQTEQEPPTEVVSAGFTP